MTEENLEDDGGTLSLTDSRRGTNGGRTDVYISKATDGKFADASLIATNPNNKVRSNHTQLAPPDSKFTHRLHRAQITFERAEAAAPPRGAAAELAAQPCDPAALARTSPRRALRTRRACVELELVVRGPQ